MLAPWILLPFLLHEIAATATTASSPVLQRMEGCWRVGSTPAAKMFRKTSSILNSDLGKQFVFPTNFVKLERIQKNDKYPFIVMLQGEFYYPYFNGS